MDRTARLIKTSAEMRRQIWASLPFDLRLAHFFTRMAASSVEALGQAIYSEFLRKGITGMPDVGSRPASDYVGKRNVRLPRTYGMEFGKKAFMMLLSKYKNPTFADDVAGGFIVDFLSGWSETHLKPGTDLKEAQSYVLKALDFKAKREKKRVRQRHLTDDGSELDLEGMRDSDTVQRQVLRQLPKMQGKLKAIHPDAPLYVKLSLIDGYSDTEIIGNPEKGDTMLKHPQGGKGGLVTVKLWNTWYKKKINEVLKKEFSHLQTGA